MKIYMVIEKSGGNYGGWGQYVSLCGIYTNKHKADVRKEELDKRIDEIGYLIEEEEEEDFRRGARYMYEIVPVEVNKDIGIFLGGYAE